MAVVVFQHDEAELPGRLGSTLRDHGFVLDVRRLDLAGEWGLPPDLDNVQGVVSLGGPQNVTDADLARHRWMAAELEFLRQAHQRQLPVVGICLGAQLLARALGGAVEPMPEPEWGFEPIDLTPDGQTDVVLTGISWTSPQFCCHEYQIAAVPPGATVLARSRRCEVQAFRAGLRSYGFQYHFECDRDLIERYARRYAATLQRLGLSAETLLDQADACYERYARLGDRLCVNLTTLLFPVLDRLSAAR